MSMTFEMLSGDTRTSFCGSIQPGAVKSESVPPSTICSSHHMTTAVTRPAAVVATWNHCCLACSIETFVM